MSQILLVEDEPDSCDALSSFLRKAGHDVECVPNGKAALAVLLHTTPDLVVLDLALPEMDGARLLEIIRSYLRLNAVPIVVWTGMGESSIVDRARQFNLKSVIMKGQANFDDVLAAISAALQNPVALGGSVQSRTNHYHYPD